ncbi:MAG TPA: hypothetical protein VKA09_13360, partial [Nitrososphaeraceae archaeon]|nr:hypothetical protein [Nitrososphaeraceae archaeon]
MTSSYLSRHTGAKKTAIPSTSAGGSTRAANSASGFIKAIESGSKHLIIKRFTLRYPEQKLKFTGDGYQFDPKRGVGIAGYRGRHILFHDKCTGC